MILLKVKVPTIGYNTLNHLRALTDSSAISWYFTYIISFIHIYHQVHHNRWIDQPSVTMKRLIPIPGTLQPSKNSVSGRSFKSNLNLHLFYTALQNSVKTTWFIITTATEQDNMLENENRLDHWNNKVLRNLDTTAVHTWN